MRFIVWVAVVLVAVGASVYGWAYSGSYDVAADTPHWRVTSWFMDMVREQSIDARSANLQVPNLDDPQLISMGAAHYSEMCVACHRAPGVAESEMRQGLYPKPPDLSRGSPPPAESFWVIKHGIKMTGMPAWGKTHDDRKVWAMVAFLQKLPTLGAASYAAMTRAAQAVDDDDGHDHDHGHDADSPAQEASHQH